MLYKMCLPSVLPVDKVVEVIRRQQDFANLYVATAIRESYQPSGASTAIPSNCCANGNHTTCQTTCLNAEEQTVPSLPGRRLSLPKDTPLNGTAIFYIGGEGRSLSYLLLTHNKSSVSG
jgi:hypothetical protein